MKIDGNKTYYAAIGLVALLLLRGLDGQDGEYHWLSAEQYESAILACTAGIGAFLRHALKKLEGNAGVPDSNA